MLTVDMPLLVGQYVAEEQSALNMLSNYLNYTNNLPSNLFYMVNLN